MSVIPDPLLNWAAVILPTALAIVGVGIAIEVPKVNRTSTKWALRGILVVFGILTSTIVYFQQARSANKAKSDTDVVVRAAVAPLSAQLNTTGQKVQQLVTQNQQLVSQNAALALVEQTRQQDLSAYLVHNRPSSAPAVAAAPKFSYRPSLIMTVEGKDVQIQNVGQPPFSIVADKFGAQDVVIFPHPIRVDMGVHYAVSLSVFTSRLEKLFDGKRSITIPYHLALKMDDGTYYDALFEITENLDGEEPRVRMAVSSIEKIDAKDISTLHP